MERREFLSVVGMGTVAVACSYCLGGCKTPDPISAPTNVDFTLDITNPSFSALRNNGGYVYNAGVIVARTVSGNFVALSQVCTHQGATVVYDPGTDSFYCPSHGSQFSTGGSVLRGPAGSALMSYHTTLTGNSLHVYS